MVSIVQVAACGYGAFYVEALLNEANRKSWPEYSLAGIVDPFVKNSPQYEAILTSGIPVYNTLDEFYLNHSANLAIISSPIHLHKPQVEAALEHGSHVLCEKPLAATIQDAVYLEKAAIKHGRFLAVGFQWSFSDPIQRLKRDIIAGVLGKPLRFRTLVNWPREWAYFARNNWAGKLCLPPHPGEDEPVWVLDSIMNNATAHYLHNMFYILGKTKQESAMPESIESELYRANDIQNYDTCALRANCGGTEVLYIGSHAENGPHETLFTYVFEKAVIEYHDKVSRRVIAKFNDGSTIDYGEPESQTTKKIQQCIEAANKNSGDELPCVAGTVLPHAMCVSAASGSAPIVDFPKDMLVTDSENKITYIRDLHITLKQCYDEGLMPHEAGLRWAVRPTKVKCESSYVFKSLAHE